MKKFVVVLAAFAAWCVPAIAQTQPAIRVNCGAGAYLDSKGQTWQADFGYNTGNTSTVTGTVAGTADQTLYRSDRFIPSPTKSLAYSFPVSAGSYHVNLYFAETWTGAASVGARVFNVKLQNNLVFQNLDIFKAAGAYTALVKSADVIVSSGPLTIELDSLVQNAKINAIEITQSLATPVLKLNFAYPDGTPVTGALNYKVTTTSSSMNGNEPLVNGQATCLMIASPSLLGLIGTMNVDISLTDLTGKILWEVTLTMNPANANFGSVQSSQLTVVVQKS